MFSSKRFHSWNLEPRSSAWFLHRFKPFTRPFISAWDITCYYPTLVAHILYNNTHHLYPFLCHMIPLLHNCRGSITGLSDTGNSNCVALISKLMVDLDIWQSLYFKICVQRHHSRKSNSQIYGFSSSWIQHVTSILRRWVTSLFGKQGSNPLKTRRKVKCRGLHDTEVLIAVFLTIPLGHWAALCHISVFRPYATMQVVSLVPWFLWNVNGTWK